MNTNSAWFAAAAIAALTAGSAPEATADEAVAEASDKRADFTGIVPPSYPLCAPFVDDQIETVEGFLVVKSVEDHPNPRNAGVEPGDICLSWGTDGPKPPETLRDAWLDFLNWGRSDEDECWFARERDGRIEVFSCGGCELYECEVALGTFCLELAPTAFPKEEAERIRAAARAAVDAAAEARAAEERNKEELLRRRGVRPAGRAHSPFGDGLSALEEMEPTGADTAAAPDELVPPHLGLAFGMSAERASAVRPGLRRDGELSRPGRMVASATVPEAEGGGDCGVVYGKGYVVAGLFRGWSGECGFTPTNPGPVRVDLDDALVRLGAPTVRRVVPVQGGYRHVWAWTKGGRALAFEIERKQPHGSLQDEIRANVVAGDMADDEDGFWAATVGRTVDWKRADRIVYTYSDAPIPDRRNVRLELSEAGADGVVTDGRGTVLRSFHEPLPDFPAVRDALRDARVRWFGREKDSQPLVGGSAEFLTVSAGEETLAKGEAETGDEIWLGPHPYPKKVREVLLEALPFEIGELSSGIVLKNP